MNEEIKKYDKNGNLIYYKKFNSALRCWYKYDKNGNLIYYKDNIGLEKWKEFDENSNCIYHKEIENGDILGEDWYRYDKNNDIINISEKEFEEIENKKILSQKPISRFEIMDI